MAKETKRIGFVEFLKVSYARFKAPTPTFWKSVQRKFTRLGALFLVLGGIYESQPDGTLPAWILTAITYAGIGCAVIIAVAQFACDDEPSV